MRFIADLHVHSRYSSPRLIIPALFLIYISMVGCMPLPHYEVHVPETSGNVHRSGIPVTDAAIEVYIYPSSSDTCDVHGEAVLTAATDKQGIFGFQEYRVLHYLTYGFPAEPKIEWRLCIRVGTDTYEGWYIDRMGIISKGSVRDFDCDLDKEPVEAPNEAYVVAARGVCRAVKRN